MKKKFQKGKFYFNIYIYLYIIYLFNIYNYIYIIFLENFQMNRKKDSQILQNLKDVKLNLDKSKEWNQNLKIFKQPYKRKIKCQMIKMKQSMI